MIAAEPAPPLHSPHQGSPWLNQAYLARGNLGAFVIQGSGLGGGGLGFRV